MVIFEMWQYDFMVRAYLIGVPLAVAASLLGLMLVLKRLAMIGDGLSHTSFATMAIALFMGVTPLYVALPVVVLTSVGLLYLSQESRLKGDAAIAMVSTTAMAIGISVVSLSKGMNADIYGYMFGNILAIGRDDVYISLLLCAVVLGLYFFYFNGLFAITFDEVFAQASGVPVKRYRLLLAVLTAIIVVLGLRLVGALLIGGLIIFPAQAAMCWAKSFKTAALLAAVFGAVAMTLGLLISYLFNLPVGAAVVLLNLTIYLPSIVVTHLKK